MPRPLPLIVAVSLLALLAPPLSTVAPARGPTIYRGNTGNNGNGNSRNNRPAPPPVDTSARDAAAKDVTDAQTELEKAKADLASVATKLQAQFDATPDMVAALAAQQQAQTADEACHAALSRKLSSDPAYAAAVANKEAAEAKLKALQDADTSDPDQLTAAATEAMNVRSAVTAIESAAESSDPDVVKSKAALVAATAKVTTLRTQFLQSIRQSSEWTTASKAVDDAQAKLKSAQDALVTEQQKLDALRTGQRE
jgi:hypothetical protein